MWNRAACVVGLWVEEKERRGNVLREVRLLIHGGLSSPFFKHRQERAGSNHSHLHPALVLSVAWRAFLLSVCPVLCKPVTLLAGFCFSRKWREGL